MDKKTVYVLGNPVEPLDNAAVRLLPRLKKAFPHINFIHFDPTEELPDDDHKDLTIIDTVMGINKVQKFNDLKHWSLSPIVTAHDYDLPLTLGILKKLDRIKNVTIIGIPTAQKTSTVWRDLTQLFNAIGI